MVVFLKPAAFTRGEANRACVSDFRIRFCIYRKYIKFQKRRAFSRVFFWMFHAGLRMLQSLAANVFKLTCTVAKRGQGNSHALQKGKMQVGERGIFGKA